MHIFRACTNKVGFVAIRRVRLEGYRVKGPQSLASQPRCQEWASCVDQPVSVPYMNTHKTIWAGRR